MADPGRPRSSELDPTLDARDAAARCRLPQRIALVRTSTPHLSAETHALLRTRLQAAALILGGGSQVFLIWSVLEWKTTMAVSPFLFGLHATMTVVLLLLAALLSRKWSFGITSLRLAELVIFALPVFFFSAVICIRMPEFAAKGMPILPIGAWLAMMFTYGMFIPNYPLRAGLVLGIFAALPIGLACFMCRHDPLVAEVYSPTVLIEFSLLLIVGAAASTYGTYMVGNLRQEAFEAKQFGRYRLRSLIGKGGMGEVYLAEHQLLKRPCALKLIQPDRAGDPQALARFEREVRATARLTHWNSVEIFDYGQTDDGTFYYVMEYLPGMSLADMVAKHGPLPAERVVHLLRQTCDALAEAHSIGLIHRDIKPGNIFAAQRGGIYDVAKLLDFGLVKESQNRDAVHLTDDRSITGSPLYMAPEQALGEEIDARSDIYSLGAVAYFLLTGRPPFEGEKPLKVLFAHANEPVIPPSQRISDVPEDLEQIVLKCLAKRPSERYSAVVALEHALADCLAAGLWTRVRAADWWKAKDMPRETAVEVS